MKIARSNSYHHSFIPWFIRIWNKLPFPVEKIKSLEAFSDCLNIIIPYLETFNVGWLQMAIVPQSIRSSHCHNIFLLKRCQLCGNFVFRSVRNKIIYLFRLFTFHIKEYYPTQTVISTIWWSSSPLRANTERLIQLLAMDFVYNSMWSSLSLFF